MNSNSLNTTITNMNILLPKGIKGNYLFGDIVSVSGAQEDTKENINSFSTILSETALNEEQDKSIISALPQKIMEYIVQLQDNPENNVNIIGIPKELLIQDLDNTSITFENISLNAEDVLGENIQNNFSYIKDKENNSSEAENIEAFGDDDKTDIIEVIPFTYSGKSFQLQLISNEEIYEIYRQNNVVQGSPIANIETNVNVIPNSSENGLYPNLGNKLLELNASSFEKANSIEKNLSTGSSVFNVDNISLNISDSDKLSINSKEANSWLLVKEELSEPQKTSEKVRDIGTEVISKQTSGSSVNAKNEEHKENDLTAKMQQNKSLESDISLLTSKDITNNILDRDNNSIHSFSDKNNKQRKSKLEMINLSSEKNEEKLVKQNGKLNYIRVTSENIKPSNKLYFYKITKGEKVSPKELSKNFGGNKELSLEDLSKFNNRIAKVFGIEGEIVNPSERNLNVINLLSHSGVKKEIDFNNSSNKLENSIKIHSPAEAKALNKQESLASNSNSENHHNTSQQSENNKTQVSELNKFTSIHSDKVEVSKNHPLNLQFNNMDNSHYQNTSTLETIIKDKNLPMPKPLEIKTIHYKDTAAEITKLIQNGDTHSIELKLNPKELGSIKILIDISNNIVNTRLDVENESVKQFINANIHQLKETLQQNGMILNQFNINYQTSGQKSKAKSYSNAKNIKIDRIDEGMEENEMHPIEKDLGYNSFDYIA